MERIRNEGWNNCSSSNDIYDGCTSSNSDCFYGDKYTQSSVSDSFERLTTGNASGTISSRNEEKNMSAMIIYYNKQGAVIVSDSRETEGFSYEDYKQKIYTTENMILGQMGLNSSIINGVKIEFGKLIVDAILDGKTIDEAINQKINDTELLKLIPNNQTITIFYAKKNGEVGVYDIKKDKYPYNNATAPSNVLKNMVQPASSLYNDFLYSNFIEYGDTSDLDIMEEKLKSVMEIILKMEKERERLKLGRCYIGGKMQIARIEFENK